MVLKCYLFNARSLNNKLDSLKFLLQIQIYDIIFVTETWLNPKIPDALLLAGSNDSYSIFRKDRRDGYGGVAVFVKNTLKPVEIELPPVFSTIEAIEIDIHLNRNTVYQFICIYHPPAKALDLQCTELLCNFLLSYQACVNPVFFVGDFNMPKISWDIPESIGDSSHDIFVETCLLNGLSQLVSFPTREGNLLDLVLTSHPQTINEISVTEPFASTCDHLSISFSVLIPVGFKDRTKTHKSFPNFRKGNYAAINKYLSMVDWATIMRYSADVESLWSNICEVLNFCIEKFIPKTSRNIDKKVKYPKHIRKLLTKKKRVYKKDRRKYVEISKQYEKAVRSFYASIESKVIYSADIKKFYAYVNGKTKCKNSVPPLRNRNGALILDDTQKCSLLNEYFSSIFTNDDGNSPQFARRAPENASINSALFTYENVVEAMRKLPSKTSRSPDGYPAFFLKSIRHELAIPLCVLFELSMSTSKIPEIWKTAKVCPVFKKGLHSEPSNYRPISLTCITCKIMERIIADSVLFFLKTHNLVSKDQYGFLSSRSTCTQLLDTLNAWTKAASNKNRIDAVYIDFAKAFDTVSHFKLLLKLRSYGIGYELHAWLTEFLSNRQQAVIINNEESNMISVKSGVPQGSVLGPLLFLLYINDITDCLVGETKIKLFADDLKLYFVRKTADVTDFSQTMANVEDWVKLWQLKMALQKCHTISFGNRLLPPEINFSLFEHSLERVKCVLDVGINLTNDLKPSRHCAQISAKALQRCHLIFKSLYTKNINILVRAYITYVRPIVESCTPVWNPWLQKDIECIEKVQKFFTRLLLRRACVPYRDYKHRLEILGLKSLEYRRISFDIIMCYKIINQLVDLNINDFFRFAVGQTRGHSKKLYYIGSCPKTDFRKYFFTIRVIKIWNSLSDEIVSAPNLAIFKARLSRFSLSRFCMMY